MSEQRQPTVVVSGFGVTPQYVYQQPVKVRYLLVEALFAPVDRVFVGFSMAAPNASDFPFAYSRYDGEVLVGKSGHFDLGSVQTVRPWIVGDNKAVGGGPVIQFQARVMADIEPILTWSFVR